MEGPDDRRKEPILDYVAECASHATQESWYSWCINNKISAEYAKFFWTRVHQDDSTIMEDEHNGIVRDDLNNLKWNNWKTLVLIGPSGVGKTTWAKRVAPKPCLFVSHIDALKQFRNGFHKSIIFDDVDFSHYPRTSQIHIVDYDNPRHLHCRHATAFVPQGTHKIFTANSDPLSFGDEAIRRRCHIIRMKN